MLDNQPYAFLTQQWIGKQKSAPPACRDRLTLLYVFYNDTKDGSLS